MSFRFQQLYFGYQNNIHLVNIYAFRRHILLPTQRKDRLNRQLTLFPIQIMKTHLAL